MDHSFAPGPHPELDAVAARWTRAATPLDPAAIAALYAEDAVFFGGLPEHFVGRARIAAYFDFYRPMLASIRLGFSDMVVAETGGLLLCQGFADFAFGLTAGRTTFNRLRATLVLGGGLIRLHHFSPPPLDPPIPR